MFKWNIKIDLILVLQMQVVCLTKLKTLMFPPSCLYTKTKQHLHPTTWAPVAFRRVTTDQGQRKVSGTPPGTLLRHHKNLVESSKRHLADPTKWEATKPCAPLCPRWASLMGRCHLAVPRPGLLWKCPGRWVPAARAAPSPEEQPQSQGGTCRTGAASRFTPTSPLLPGTGFQTHMLSIEQLQATSHHQIRGLF